MSRCGIVTYGSAPAANTPTTCFNLGRGSGLFIHDFRTDGSTGSWLLGAGGNTVEVDNVHVARIGAGNDQKDYFVVAFAAPTNSLVVRNSYLGGLPSNSHVHGIHLGTNTMGSTIIQNCVFNFLNDSIIGTTNNKVVLTGSTSSNTNNTGKSVDLHGTGYMVYVGNFWDIPPTALLRIVSN
jgi:hypothetical protein